MSGSIIHRIRIRRKTGHSSHRMSVSLKQQQKNFFFPGVSTRKQPAGNIREILLPIRSGSRSSPGRSHRKNATKWATNLPCGLPKGGMPLPYQHIQIKLISTITLFSIPPAISFGLSERSRGSACQVLFCQKSHNNAIFGTFFVSNVRIMILDQTNKKTLAIFITNVSKACSQCHILTY